jgi:DNA repair ATPase RecN
MKPNREFQEALDQAQSALSERHKIMAAVTAAERELAPAIERRLAAERHLAEIESGHVLGEVDAKQLTEARKQLADARLEIDSVVARLRGLENRLVAQAAELAEAGDTLSELLPGFAAAVASEFTTEWSQVAAAYGRVLAKRAAIEQALGQTMDLLPPVAAGSEAIDDAIALPQRLSRELEQAASEIEARLRQAAQNRRVPATFDPDAIYEFRLAQRLNGRFYEAGTRVIGSQLGEAAAAWCLRSRCLARVDQLAEAG